MPKRSVRIGYLVMGLIFLGIALTWALHDWGVISNDGFHWLLPATLLVAGLIGLAATLGRSSNRWASHPAYAAPAWEPTPAPSPETTTQTDDEPTTVIDDQENHDD